MGGSGPESAEGAGRSLSGFGERVDAPFARLMDEALQQRDALAEPRQFLGGDAVMARVTRLHISRAQQLVAALLELGFGRPDLRQRRLPLLGKLSQPVQTMGLGALCRASDYSAWAWEGQDICGFWGNRLGIVLRFFPARSIGGGRHDLLIRRRNRPCPVTCPTWSMSTRSSARTWSDVKPPSFGWGRSTRCR